MRYFCLLLCAMLVACGPSSTESLVLTPDAAVYRLGTEDQLKITVFGEEDLSGAYTVQGQGLISFPLIGDIEARGLSVTEFRALIEKKLSQGIIDRPSVSVEVTNFRPYYILGEVTKPGEYSFAEGLTVFSSVAKAGGFTYRANQKLVYITHKGATEEHLYRLEGATPVQPGDTIRIAERIF